LTQRNRLFRKYAAYFVVLVLGVLIASGAVALSFSYQETRATLAAVHREKAVSAAIRIEQFLRDIEQNIAWTETPPGRTAPSYDQRYIDFLKFLRQVPAITDIAWIDANGREQIRASRLTMDRVGGGEDRSRDARFLVPKPGQPYFSSVYFHKETEPYLTVAVNSGRKHAGVTAVEVNLKFVWDVISRIRVGETGYAYVVDDRGQLVSHPDISLVLQKSDLSALPQVQAALAARATSSEGDPELIEALDTRGRPMLAAYAPIAPIGWSVLVEQPLNEAYAPLYHSLMRTGFLLLLGLIVAVVASLLLARRMVTPIKTLQDGAARIGAGALDQHIDVHTGDELETLAEEFNLMTTRLRDSYTGLEQKVTERTQELAAANQAKTRFLAAASHDLRQPMHALGMFVAQLRGSVTEPRALALVDKVESAVTALQELLDALLDISRLDAGVVTSTSAEFAMQPMLTRLDRAFAPQAEEKGLRLRAVPSRLAVCSDPVLLERILINLLANAVRYTERGGIVIGCRRHGDKVRVEVWDSGAGIAPQHRESIFKEFYQVGNPERDRRKGLGLGLAIATRLARLLGSRIDLVSQPGKGSVFSIELPRGIASESAAPKASPVASLRGMRVLMVDDDALVRDAMASLLEQWGCEVWSAGHGAEAEAILKQAGEMPDAIVCDYRLPDGETGIDVIHRLQAIAGTEVPAALVTGDTAPERLREANESGYALLHKPVQPAKLRLLLTHLTRGTKQRVVAG
jgi:signal transduction histidine kinase